MSTLGLLCSPSFRIHCKWLFGEGNEKAQKGIDCWKVDKSGLSHLSRIFFEGFIFCLVISLSEFIVFGFSMAFNSELMDFWFDW